MAYTYFVKTASGLKQVGPINATPKTGSLVVHGGALLKVQEVYWDNPRDARVILVQQPDSRLLSKGAGA